ncbi:class I SAM-dependent methyltransferase [Patescibacteria group bacterium]|nr:class I SAM-dependent methyltransferase [Patescibacteria group bacterium]
MASPLSFDQKYYSTGSYDDYLEQFAKEGLQYARFLVAELKPKAGWTFLDIGCGPGGLVAGLRKMGFQTRGVEISPFARRMAPKEVQRYLQKGSATKIPFPEKKFDVSTCVDVLCYLTPKQIISAAKEISRVTRNQAYLEVITLNSPNASQKENPDLLRKEKNLLTEDHLLELLNQGGLRLNKKTTPYPGCPDFYGFFKPKSTR